MTFVFRFCGLCKDVSMYNMYNANGFSTHVVTLYNHRKHDYVNDSLMKVTRPYHTVAVQYLITDHAFNKTHQSEKTY